MFWLVQYMKDVVTVTDETSMTALWLWRICTISFCFPFQIFILLQFTCNCCLISYEQSNLFSYFLFLFCYHWYVLWIITFHFNVYMKEKCYSNFWFCFVHNMFIINFKRVIIFFQIDNAQTLSSKLLKRCI